MRVWVRGVGVLGPGLDGWERARAVLAGEAAYAPAATAVPTPAILPAAERRRSSAAIRLAVAAAEAAARAAGLPLGELATVFTSSDGDAQVVHQLCETLATPAREVSPSRFHVSVHNAQAAYWAIAAGARTPSTSLCAYDASFAAGLLEAAVQVVAEGQPVLLVAHDLPMPEPLLACRPVSHAFACALVLTPERGDGAGPNHDARPRGNAASDESAGLDTDAAHKLTPAAPAPAAPTPASGGAPALACWDLRLEAGGKPTSPPAGLPAELSDNPAARSLPLLAALAAGAPRTVRLAYLDGTCLRVDHVPAGP